MGRAAVAWTLLEGRDLAQGMVALPSGNSVALGKLVKIFVSSSVNEMLSLMTQKGSAHLRTSRVPLEETRAPGRPGVARCLPIAAFILGGGEGRLTIDTI